MEEGVVVGTGVGVTVAAPDGVTVAAPDGVGVGVLPVGVRVGDTLRVRVGVAVPRDGVGVAVADVATP